MLTLVMLLLLVSIGHAATYYAAPTNTTSNASCDAATNSTTPINGLVQGIGCLGSGDTLVLKSGTYTEQALDIIPSGTASSYTTIRAETSRGAIIDARNLSGVVMLIGTRNTQSRSYIKLQGLVIDGTGRQALGGWNHIQTNSGIPDVNCDTVDPATATHHLWIVDNELKGGDPSNSLSGVAAMGLSCAQHHHVIENNLIHDIGWIGANTSNTEFDYGIYMSNGNHDNLVQNNEFYHIEGYSIHNYCSAGTCADNVFRNNYIHDTGSGILFNCGGHRSQVYNNIVARVGLRGFVYTGTSAQTGGLMFGASCNGTQSTDNQVYNNTMVWNKGNGGAPGCIGLTAGAGVTNSLVKNNICWQTGGGDIIAQGAANSGNTLSNNLCSGTGCSVSSDPLFVTNIPDADMTQNNIRPADFKLQPTSPALNVGADVSSVLTTDYGGSQRPAPAGSSFDLGAWEMGGSSGTIIPQTLYVYWRLDESSGATAYDSATHDLPLHDGTLTTSPAPGHVGARVGPQGLSMPGSGSYVATTVESWPANQDVTLAFWVKIATWGDSVGVGFGTATPNLMGVCVGCAGGPENNLYWQYGTWNDPGGTGSMYTSFIPYVGSWTHVVVQGRGNGSEGRIWLNGTLVAGPTGFSAPTGLASPFAFEAGRWNKPGHVINGPGLLDDVRLYTQYLSDTEIKTLYRSTAGRVRHTAQGH